MGLVRRSVEPGATEWFQSINALAIFLLAPVFAWLWTYLDRRGLNPSMPAKMAIGLLFMSLAFGLMIVAAQRENGPTSVPFGPLPGQIKLSPSNQLVRGRRAWLEALSRRPAHLRPEA